MRKRVGHAPIAGEQTQKYRVGRLPTSEQNWKIILSEEVRCRIGMGCLSYLQKRHVIILRIILLISYKLEVFQ
jgi:hypothetical protein